MLTLKWPLKSKYKTILNASIWFATFLLSQHVMQL